MASTPRTSLREAQKQLTRARLLDAAAELFSTQGYGATTIEDIATAAGATRATFYLHFSSKSDVVHGFYEALVEYDPDYGDLIAVARAPTQAGLHGWLARFIDGLDHQRAYWIALGEAAGADPDARAALDHDWNLSAEKLASGLQEARDWSPEHAHLVAVVLKRQLDVANDTWLRGRWDAQREPLFGMLARMWLTALSDD
jgi:AcrR family transcriptional regulator